MKWMNEQLIWLDAETLGWGLMIVLIGIAAFAVTMWIKSMGRQDEERNLLVARWVAIYALLAPFPSALVAIWAEYSAQARPTLITAGVLAGLVILGLAIILAWQTHLAVVTAGWIAFLWGNSIFFGLWAGSLSAENSWQVTFWYARETTRDLGLALMLLWPVALFVSVRRHRRLVRRHHPLSDELPGMGTEI